MEWDWTAGLILVTTLFLLAWLVSKWRMGARISIPMANHPTPSVNPPSNPKVFAPPPKAARASGKTYVIDVETTGLYGDDRIVTLAAICLVGMDAQKEGIYLIFDPRKDCHPEAAKLHGWDDWTLMHQNLFETAADELHQIFSNAECLVAHNANFDLSFLDREFEIAGLPPLTGPSFCTMVAARERWPRRRARLDDCLKRIGVRGRSKKTHSAYEDAFHAMNLYRYFMGAKVPYTLESAPPMPTNFIAPPPIPEGPMPKRKAKRRKKRPYKES